MIIAIDWNPFCILDCIVSFIINTYFCFQLRGCQLTEFPSFNLISLFILLPLCLGSLSVSLSIWYIQIININISFWLYFFIGFLSYSKTCVFEIILSVYLCQFRLLRHCYLGPYAEPPSSFSILLSSVRIGHGLCLSTWLPQEAWGCFPLK